MSVSTDSRLIELLDSWQDAPDKAEHVRLISDYFGDTLGRPAEVKEAMAKAADAERRLADAKPEADKQELRAHEMKRAADKAVSEKQIAEREAAEAREACDEMIAKRGRLEGKIAKLEDQLEKLTVDRAARLIQGEEILQAIRALPGGVS